MTSRCQEASLRYLTPITLGVLLVLGTAGSVGSQTLSDPRIQRCKSGLERGIAACSNMHDVGSDNWRQCLNYSIVTYHQCVAEVLEMDTIPGPNTQAAPERQWKRPGSVLPAVLPCMKRRPTGRYGHRRRRRSIG